MKRRNRSNIRRDFANKRSGQKIKHESKQKTKNKNTRTTDRQTRRSDNTID